MEVAVDDCAAGAVRGHVEVHQDVVSGDLSRCLTAGLFHDHLLVGLDVGDEFVLQANAERLGGDVAPHVAFDEGMRHVRTIGYGVDGVDGRGRTDLTPEVIAGDLFAPRGIRST